MTIPSSLNAGVAGLSVNASRLATISDNIANSGTFGYKRAVADFQSLVISQGQGSYSAGGVRVTTGRMIDQRGNMITTENPTDLAIGGRGMLPVTSATALDDSSGSMPAMLTTTGSFRPDAEGYLRTDDSLVLMGWPANPDGTIPNFPRDSFVGLEPVRINTSQLSGDPTTQMELSVNLPATSTKAGASGDALTMSAEYFDNLGTSENIEITFTPTVPGSGTSHEWVMEIRDSATGATPIGEYTLTFDDTRGNGGNLDAVAQAMGAAGGAYDPATGSVTVNVNGGPLEISIGLLGDPSGLTQLSDTFARSPVVKNGSPVGSVDSVEVDANGSVNAIYDSGLTRSIYQIPVVDVPNPNGLISLSKQVYQVSPDSGSFFLWNAGDGPVGDMIGFAREQSTTDVAGEMTQLIQTQRAYSSNAKVIQTVDEMLQETTNIKR
ncbi:flagellar hook-basal body complex protein [Rhodophyticola sp. CCM32]|uniref:flagellar hook protein FlgE n=1 Tax=Rhodophyticola sp. CCM32 TaxID=2916397 RepID=UPI00107FCA0A|nr:flagellar hook-basal body complex protein [Rhodophyticola sp. CCM32]QBY02235.1 flagellar hook-basal body complex protein [Rhodophyticola sp. CCM32]